MKRWALLVLVVSIVGCGKHDVPVAQKGAARPSPSSPTSISPSLKATPPGKPLQAEPKVDPRLAGEFTSTDGKSVLSLGANGFYRLHTKSAVKLANGRKKPVDGTVEGRWGVHKTKMMLKQTNGYSGEYEYKFENEKLTLKGSPVAKPAAFRRTKK